VPRFLLKVLTADTAKRWRRRFCTTATISAKRHGMVIAVRQREMLLAASARGCRFHTSLGCVAGSCWIQKSLGLATPAAMFVPTTKFNSHEPVIQQLIVINRKAALVVLLRFWDGAVPFSGRISSLNLPYRGSRSNASAPLPVRRFISTNEPPCASAI
jgi:hypothetical protein